MFAISLKSRGDVQLDLCLGLVFETLSLTLGWPKKADRQTDGQLENMCDAEIVFFACHSYAGSEVQNAGLCFWMELLFSYCIFFLSPFIFEWDLWTTACSSTVTLNWKMFFFF